AVVVVIDGDAALGALRIGGSFSQDAGEGLVALFLEFGADAEVAVDDGIDEGFVQGEAEAVDAVGLVGAAGREAFAEEVERLGDPFQAAGKAERCRIAFEDVCKVSGAGSGGCLGVWLHVSCLERRTGPGDAATTRSGWWQQTAPCDASARRGRVL